MPVYIDDSRLKIKGRRWCLMTAIPANDAELLRIARKIGARDARLHNRYSKPPRFNVAVEYRDLAISQGAVPVTRLELSGIREKYRKQIAKAKGVST